MARAGVNLTKLSQQGSIMVCENVVLGLCIVKATGSPEASIFGFGDFITALALLVIVYTVTDIRYRFRIAVTPGNLPHLPCHVDVHIDY